MCVVYFGTIFNSFCFLFQPEKLNVYKNDSDTSWDYTLLGKNYFIDICTILPYYTSTILPTVQKIYTTYYSNAYKKINYNIFIFTQKNMKKKKKYVAKIQQKNTTYSIPNYTLAIYIKLLLL